MSTTKFNWAADQLAIFDWVQNGQGSAVVEAVAGAGKTTTLVEAVRRMSGTVFLGAYNKKMADELKGRVAGIKGVVAGTFHSAGFGALRRSTAARLEVKDDKVRVIVRALIQGSDLEDEQGWVPAICNLVSLAKQSGFFCRGNGLVERPSSSDWMNLVERHDIADRLPESSDPRILCRLAARALETSNNDKSVIDFDDMVYLPLQRDLRLFRNDWVLIDEAQDTNATRRALAERMLKRGGRLVAIGDPHQAIFGFTGADSDSLDLIRSAFEATTLRLSVTWRCPRTVVTVARNYVQHITAAASAPEGEHMDVEYAEMMAMAQPGDAVICRYNKYIVELCFRLIRQGKPAKIEGRAIGEGLAALAGRWKVRDLDVLEDRLDTYREKELEKARVKEDEAKAERINDQVDTMVVLIQRAREVGITTVSALQDMIRSMFDDVGSSSRLVVLSSVHRSKGLEWKRVFVLGRRELMPSPRAKQPWQVAQEINLCYVAVTRAQQTLVDVALPPEGEVKVKAKVEEVA